MYGRADVVGNPTELGVGEGPCAAAERRLRLQNLHRQTGAGAHDGGGQAVGSAADHGDVHARDSAALHLRDSPGPQLAILPPTTRRMQPIRLTA